MTFCYQWDCYQCVALYKVIRHDRRRV